MAHQTLLPFTFYRLLSSTRHLHIYDTLVMFSKLFTLSAALGLLAAMSAMPAQATGTEVEVVAGGPDGLIQYNPSFVVGVPYNFSS
jgi:hypothetical protein